MAGRQMPPQKRQIKTIEVAHLLQSTHTLNPPEALIALAPEIKRSRRQLTHDAATPLHCKQRIGLHFDTRPGRRVPKSVVVRVPEFPTSLRDRG